MRTRRFGTVSIPGNRVGAIISIGVVALAWITIPLSRPFILCAGGLGLAIGLFLRWRHDRQWDSANQQDRAELPRLH
jgi:hypothetical protein